MLICFLQGLPRFPNALTTPLPRAPSLSWFSLYGYGIPTERAYVYLHPDDWHPDRDHPFEEVSEGKGCKPKSKVWTT